MAGKKKILIIDDDKTLQEMYKERLELSGYDTELASDGEKGLAKIHKMPPNIILLDVMMPKINGFDVLGAIKSNPKTKDIPVIVFSALPKEKNQTKSHEIGADDYLVKSETLPKELIKRIDKALAK